MLKSLRDFCANYRSIEARYVHKICSDILDNLDSLSDKQDSTPSSLCCDNVAIPIITVEPGHPDGDKATETTIDLLSGEILSVRDIKNNTNLSSEAANIERQQ